MTSKHIQHNNRKTSQKITSQRGFLTIGIGIGLTALFGAIGSLVVANHELNNKDNFISEQYIELQEESAATDETNYDS